MDCFVLRTCNDGVLLIIITQFLFQLPEYYRHNPVHNKIKCTGYKQRPEGKKRSLSFLCNHQKLRNSNDRNKSCIFYKGNYFVAHCRNNSFNYLGQYNCKKGLALCITQNLTGFVLAFWNCFYSAAIYFCKISCIIYTKGNYGCRKSVPSKVYIKAYII